MGFLPSGPELWVLFIIFVLLSLLVLAILFPTVILRQRASTPLPTEGTRRMYCPNCGSESDESAKFCRSCGKALSGTEERVSPSDTDTFDASRGSPAGDAGNAPAGPTASYGAVPHIPNYLVQAILVTIFCCLPFGIVSIVFAAQVNGKVAAGDITGARVASRNAKTWAWIAFGVGLVPVSLFVIYSITTVSAL